MYTFLPYLCVCSAFGCVACATGPRRGQRGVAQHPAHQGHRPTGQRVHHLQAADPLAHLQHRAALVRQERRNAVVSAGRGDLGEAGYDLEGEGGH